MELWIILGLMLISNILAFKMGDDIGQKRVSFRYIRYLTISGLLPIWGAFLNGKLRAINVDADVAEDWLEVFNRDIKFCDQYKAKIK